MTHELAQQLLANPISPKHLLGSYGLVGLIIIIFAECGLLVGFFLPGDTLLFSAGLLIAINDPSINLPPLWVLLVALPLAAITGNLVGYWIGRKAGPPVFDRPGSRMFRPEYVDRAQTFFDRFGPATVLLARFVPVVRTVATVLAGVGKMRFDLYARLLDHRRHRLDRRHAAARSGTGPHQVRPGHHRAQDRLDSDHRGGAVDPAHADPLFPS